MQDLVTGGLYDRLPGATDPLLLQMLQALDYLGSENVLHRDLKPGNILYKTTSSGEHVYFLADFGLCNNARIARTLVGSPHFEVPELVMQMADARQTPKMDVWSLFVTIAYVLNVQGYRERTFSTDKQTFIRENLQAIQTASEDHQLRRIVLMAEFHPLERASAGDMIDALFGGTGRCTPSRANLFAAAGTPTAEPEASRGAPPRPGEAP